MSSRHFFQHRLPDGRFAMFPTLRSLPRAFARALAASWRDGHHVALGLFRFLIPIVVAVKILTEVGAIRYLALDRKSVV